MYCMNCPYYGIKNIHVHLQHCTLYYITFELGMGDMGLKIYHNISGIYCDNDINDDNSGNPVSLEKSIIFPIFTPNRVL